MQKKRMAGLLLALWLLGGSGALADTVSVSGTVVNIGEETILAPFGGTVEEIRVKPGDAVQAGDVIAGLKTRKVYALEDGVVRLFGQPGESVEMIANQYGAVAYVEPLLRYTLEASGKTADTSNEANSIIHPGETVYLRGVEDMKRTGSGLVTAVSGGSFTVLISRGSLQSGDSVNIYRDPAFSSNTRLGKGTVSLKDPAAYAGEGIVAAFAIENGAEVKKGDVLYELLDGSYSGNGFTGPEILAPCDGVIASLSIARGTDVGENAAAAVMYPDDALRVEALVSETDLHFFRPGDAVTIEFSYLNDGLLTVGGTVESVSLLGEASGDSEEGWFRVYVKPEETAALSYGAHAVVTLEAPDGEK